MRRVLAALVLSASAFAAPAFAQSADECVEPYAPYIIDGATATEEQLSENRLDVIAFLGLSDMYQECLVRLMSLEEIKNNPSALRLIEKRIADNQREKERVGAEFNATVAAWRAQHPEPEPAPAAPPPAAEDAPAAGGN
ncbi:MAG TPA: hypothetical protein PLA85_09870 [Micropepsaceae bacterium]|nr:hypothetical protein [Micropepsaceae bacterium]